MCRKHKWLEAFPEEKKNDLKHKKIKKQHTCTDNIR